MDWKLKMRCSRSSLKKLPIFLSSFVNPPIFTNCNPARHGFTKSSGELKLVSMNEPISALYNFSSHVQNFKNDAASILFENRLISSAISWRPCTTFSSLPSAYTALYMGSTFLMVT